MERSTGREHSGGSNSTRASSSTPART
ncbi:unnamed protein product [Linum tenue]|uniref:Uncharacterized protein n=1 Tax=Linum tenue TaxID=586396 RepID=A0AAV0PI46_9ROSI|nr:unnamed protein product [Linum tenue]